MVISITENGYPNIIDDAQREKIMSNIVNKLNAVRAREEALQARQGDDLLKNQMREAFNFSKMVSSMQKGKGE